MVTSRPVLLVGAVGDGLVKAAMLGFGEPVGAEGDLFQIGGRPGTADAKREQCASGEPGKCDSFRYSPVEDESP